LGNWIPFFEDGNRGCFFWGFGIYCDIQLFILIPPLVYLLAKRKVWGFIVLYLIIAINIIISILVTWRYDLKAGPLALENYYSFSYLMYKPYSKLAPLSIGIQFGYLYHYIIRYRKSQDPAIEYPKIHYLHQNRYMGPLFNILGLALIITCLFCGYEALKDPYSWPMWKNFLYFAFVRIAYVIGALLIITSMFLGRFNSGMRSLRNPYFRALGKLSFESALISPIVIICLYCGQDYTMYLTVFRGIAFGMGNILSIVLASLIIFLFIEYPLKRMG
jgi:hypothetical protein